MNTFKNTIEFKYLFLTAVIGIFACLSSFKINNKADNIKPTASIVKHATRTVCK